MNISTTPNSSFVRPYVTKVLASAEMPAASDSVTLSSGAQSNLKETVTLGLAGAVPGVGALSNFYVAYMTGLNRNNEASKTAFRGMLANVFGTGALVTGLLFGNSPTTMVGGGLLLASGLAGAYSVSQPN
jgi:hypothetical protein